MIPIHHCFLQVDLRTELWANGCSKRLWLGDRCSPMIHYWWWTQWLRPLLAIAWWYWLWFFHLLSAEASNYLGKLYVSGLACVNRMVASWFFAAFSFLRRGQWWYLDYQLTYTWGANLKQMTFLRLGNDFWNITFSASKFRWGVICFGASVLHVWKSHHFFLLLTQCRLGLMCWLLKPKMHLFKHTLHRTKCLRPLFCNKLFLKSCGHVVLKLAFVLDHHEPFILGMNSRHWHCFSEEDSIGMIKKVSATVSGRFMEKFLIKVARLRRDFIEICNCFFAWDW